MAMQDNALIRNGGDEVSVQPLDYSEIADDDLRVALQRCEERILSHTQDMVDSLLAMAGEFHRVRNLLSTTSSTRGGSQWTRWIARFPGISRSTAASLADVGRLERSELESLRSGLFSKNGGIAGIAAYLNAPAEVQERVQSGEVSPRLHDIRDAARAFKEAQEAQQRAEAAEQRARQAQAGLEAQIQEVRREAQLQGQIAVQEATARLQREADEARHVAELRQRDMEEAQRQIQRAQADWQQRLTEATTRATTEERVRLAGEFDKRMRELQDQLKAQARVAETARREANELNQRLTHARDSEAVRARWEALAVSLIDRLDADMLKLPSQVDAQCFEAHERTLVESIRKRAELLTSRMQELERAATSIVEAGS